MSNIFFVRGQGDGKSMIAGFFVFPIKRRPLILLSLLLLGALSITTYRLILLTNRNAVDREDDIIRLQKLPHFSAFTVSGNLITARALFQKVVYVQFMDGRNEDEIRLFKAVNNNWGSKGVSLILAVSHIANFMNRKDENLLPAVHIIDRQKNEEFAKAFMLARGEYRYFVFDKDGLLRDSAYAARGYEEGPKAELRNLILGENFDLEAIFP